MSTILPTQTDSFTEYRREFESLISIVNQNLTSAKSASDTSSTSLLDEADANLQEAIGVLKSMELESQTLDAATRSAHRSTLTSARAAVTAARADVRNARVQIASKRADQNRGDLLGTDERLRMHDTTQDLEAGTALINDSHRHIAETEAVGAGILADLQSQRSTITRARQHIVTVDSGLEESGSIIGTMHRRAIMNRIIIYMVLAGVGVACFGIIYARVFHGRS